MLVDVDVALGIEQRNAIVRTEVAEMADSARHAAMKR
jgi:hypothetical protein